ncbi:heavy metal translocating P-type ATPase [Helicobacter anatolicus]|uniref:heavy metal translocating P-type ATPase n=1 Tax=Helicobacter anatolicus TaxID=2905874 RepID=UPI001E2C0BF9|nr:heavy metal translocating P-type ATPase [Helicobacter anatolicus]MCE3038263.1 cadmium-translocating P-type ATPase [Helicobacter anatolicus]
MKEVFFSIKGMTCSACSSGIERSLKRKKGIKIIEVNLVSENARVEYDENLISLDSIFAQILKMGYTPNAQKEKKISSIEKWDDVFLTPKRRVILSLFLSIVILYLSMFGMFSEALSAENLLGVKLSSSLQLVITLLVMHLGRKFYIRGFGALVYSSPNMDSLVALGSGAAFLYSLFIYIKLMFDGVASALYFESVCVIISLILLGKYLEQYAKTKSLEQLNLVLNFYQKTTLRQDSQGVFQEVLLKDVYKGDILKILPGGTIPVDGIIQDGGGNIDESMISGESLPVYKTVGDSVLAGTIILDQGCIVKVEKDSQHSTIAEVLKLVRKAQDTKAPIARFADVISGYFVPFVIVVAICTMVFWWVYKQDFSFALKMFINILVVSCPCALGLATPMAILIASTQGIKNSLLFKDSKILENAHKVDMIIFDKTGTLTEGKLEVCKVEIFDPQMEVVKLLEIARSLEERSEHPIAKAIIQYADNLQVKAKEASEIKNTAGMGIEGVIDGICYKMGNKEFFKEKIDISGYTSVVIGSVENGKEKILGILFLEDKIKANAKKVIDILKSMKFKIMILSGDDEKVVQNVAQKLGIDMYFGNLKPHEKYNKIEDLKASGMKVMMIGDGLNDAPALALADVSLAMGGGNDLSKERADIVVLNNNIYGVVNAIRLSAKTFLNIKQNLFWAFFYNIIAISIACGLLYHWNIMFDPMIAAFAMCMSSLSVIFNAQRLRAFKFIK